MTKDIRNPLSLLPAEANVSIMRDCVNMEIIDVLGLHAGFKQELDGAYKELSYNKDHSVEALAAKLHEVDASVLTHIYALQKARQSVLDLASQPGAIHKRFAASKTGKSLIAAWTALLDADIEYLPTINSYAPNDLDRTATELFRLLLKTARITFATDGGGAGAMSGFKRGSYTFVVDGKGLKAAYDRVFDSEQGINDIKMTCSIVSGTVLTGDTWQPSKDAPITDPVAVKALAETLSQRIQDAFKV